MFENSELTEDQVDIYFTVKTIFTEADYAVLGTLLDSNLGEEEKATAIMTLFAESKTRYVNVHGKEPLEGLGDSW